MADIDPLTHLRSRGTMDSEISQNLCEAAAKERPLSVIMVDIDHFKRVNVSIGVQN
jgi:diguanylate cyclase (GGDEF)-like protein